METRICKDCGQEKPIEQFKVTRWGDRVHVCTDCANAKLAKTRKQKAQQKAIETSKTKLANFTPRELMAELYRRGYEGVLTFVVEKKIDISKIDE